MRALLARLDAANDRPPRGERIAEAALRVRASDPDLDAAALAEATRWLTALAERAENVARLGELVALSTEADFFDARADRVSLPTMDAATGLEFAEVFVVGLEDGIVPFSQMALPRRLFPGRRLMGGFPTRSGGCSTSR